MSLARQAWAVYVWLWDQVAGVWAWDWGLGLVYGAALVAPAVLAPWVLWNGWRWAAISISPSMAAREINAPSRAWLAVVIAAALVVFTAWRLSLHGV